MLYKSTFCISKSCTWHTTALDRYVVQTVRWHTLPLVPHIIKFT